VVIAKEQLWFETLSHRNSVEKWWKETDLSSNILSKCLVRNWLNPTRARSIKTCLLDVKNLSSLNLSLCDREFSSLLNIQEDGQTSKGPMSYSEAGQMGPTESTIAGVCVVIKTSKMMSRRVNSRYTRTWPLGFRRLFFSLQDVGPKQLSLLLPVVYSRISPRMIWI